MKDPYLVNKRNRRTKIKILVSFNGGFRRRQPSGKLRYTGGETRILSVDRGITFFKLKSQVLELVVQSGNGCCTLFSLKYQLQDCSESERSDLFSITSDDDVACMIDEFEKREFQGKLTRLWVFACSNNNGFLDNYDLHGIKSCGDINMKTHLSKSDHNKGSSNKKLSSDDSLRKMKLSSDDSLRKMVLKQQLLAKQYCSSNRIRRDYSESGNYRVNNMLDYEYRSCDFGGNGNFQKDLPIPLSKSRALNSKDNNLRLGVNCSMNGPLEKSDCSGVSLESGRPGAELPSLESSRIDRVDAKLEATCVDSTQLSSLNRENIVPRSMDCDMGRNGVDLLSRNNQLIASVPAPMQGNQEVLVGGTRCSLHNNRVGLSESRNARIYPYQIRNRGNGYEMGKHHSLRLNGKSFIGKILPDLRYGSSILKRGQTARSYSFTSSKNGSGHQCPTVKDMTEMNDDSCALEEVVDHLNYGSIVRSDGSPLPINSDTRPMNRQKDLLSCPDTGKPETQCQALSRDVHDSSTSCQSLSDISKDLGLLNQQEVNESISLEDSLNWSCGSTTSSFNQKTADSFQQSISSVLDLSLHDLNLSKSSKLELEGSPHSRNDISQSFLKPQCHNSDAMDEEYLSSGPRVEESSGDVSCSLVDSDFRKKNHNNSEEDIQHNTQTNPSICEQVEIEKTKKSSNVNGVIPADISAYNPYAAKPGLQTIKNTDLEYIKELGSGTYGTVFYGKWKGSDVAIKRLKPSCFTEGTVEEDRLVTDFWKEAHILGQLHHPNIVALYGVVIDGPVTNLATVTEYMVNGSLKQVLRRKDRTIDRRKRLIIAMDAAFGMEYLHEKNIVHFDLKSHNFLVNMRDPQRPVCKIGDLGLSKIKQRTLVSGGVRGTIPWMAPELLNGENMVSEKVDIYSFGIVMWELLTGEEPYSKMRAEEVIVGIISGGLRPDVPSWCDPGWRSLMERCWSSDPKARPAFSEIAKELRAMAAAMNIK